MKLFTFTFKRQFLNLAIILIFLSGTKQNKCITQNEILQASAGVAICGIASYYLYKFFFNVPIQEVINNANNDIRKSQNYLPHIDILKKRFNIKVMSDSEKNTATGRITEDLAYELITPVNYYTVSNYLDSLSQIISQLKNHRSTLYKFYTKLDNFHLYDIKTLLNFIDDNLPQLEFLHLYVTKHKTFFELHKIGKSMAEYHHKALEIFLSYIEPQIREELKMYARKTYYVNNFPYIEFVKILNSDISALERGIRNLSYRYPQLLDTANTLKNRLAKIRDFIIVDSEYSAEKKSLEENKVKEEKIKLEQQQHQHKVDIDKQKLELDRQKFLLEQAKLKMEMERINLEKQKLTAMQEQTKINREFNRRVYNS